MTFKPLEEYLPVMWGTMLKNLTKNGFTRDEAIDLIEAYIEAAYRPAPIVSH